MAADRGFLDISIVGDRRGVEAMMLRLEAALSPAGLSLWLDQFVEPWLETRARDRFASEGDDVSGAWLPLKPYTQMVRAQLGFPPDHPINVRTGELERYITSSGGSVTAFPGGAVLEFPGNKPTGDLAEKVATAQKGSTSNVSYTPPRPVLGVNIHDLEYALLSLATFIQRQP